MLRAGHVAILDGAFRYFCDASCKASYVDAVSKRPSLEAMTAAPPSVASVTASAPAAVVASGVREHEGREPGRRIPEEEAASPIPAPPAELEPGPATIEAPSEGVRTLPPVVDRGEPETSAAEPEPEPEEEGEPSPSTLRSPSSAELEPARPGRAAEKTASDPAREEPSVPARLVALAPAAGIFAGILSAVVSLAGEPAGAVRLPLALVAAVLVLSRKVFGSREPSEPSPWVVVGPIVLASGVAIASALLHHVHMDAHASFVGLAAASVLIADVLLARARRDVIAARARTMSMLAVPARVVRADGVEEIDASEVKPGEQVVVNAGETIPVDGIVAAGEAEVAPWLDSPMLASKAEGSAVVAGAAVVSGRLRVNTTFSGNERAWLRLLSPANVAAAAARIEIAAPLVVSVRRLVERGAPAVGLVVAGAVYADNGSWLDVAIAASAGSFALGAVAAVAGAALAHGRGHAAAQRRGIVYKDAAAFDTAARADVAVVCSRGTILLGEPEIVAVEAITKEGISPKGWLRSPTPSLEARLGRSSDPSADPSDIARVLAIAAGAEISSAHPFAAAILRAARARGVKPDNVRSAIGHSGLGVTALAANGERVIVGSRAFLLKEKVSVAIAEARASELEAQGRSVLLVAVAGRLVGLLALQDGLRPGARAAVQRLHDARIEPVLLSGEARDTCETIARALDIEHVRPEILPADRGDEVRALADGGRVVAAIGHASSDDGALGAADVSIAMEAAGAAPGEWGVALASDDVRDAALALAVPRASRDRARTALAVGGVAQALGALGIAFGIAPAAIVPVLGVLAAAAVASIVREPALAADRH